MSEAPKMIWAWGHSADRKPFRGFSTEQTDEGCAYRRADIPWLPDELVERLRFLTNYDWQNHTAGMVSGKLVADLLRDILAALKEESNE